MIEKSNTMKEIVSEFLAFLKYKVDNDILTMEEVESMCKLFEKELMLIGTADDFARFYGQPRTNISSAINRGMLDKPIRRVFYRFNSLRKIVPAKWKCHE